MIMGKSASWDRIKPTHNELVLLYQRVATPKHHLLKRIKLTLN